MNASRENLNIVMLGDVDHGKSTLLGRILLATNSLPRDLLKSLRKLARDLGEEVELAFLADHLEEERERRMTMDTTQLFFKTPQRNYVLIDAPGHLELIKNAITGASQAQAAILVIDVTLGMTEQSKRHAFIANLLGIRQLIVAVNKMDLIQYEKKKFEEIKQEITTFLERLNLNPAFVVPVSGMQGVNIHKKSRPTRWYHGPPLLKCLDLLGTKKTVDDKPLRFPVQDIYALNGKSVVVGKISSGILKQNQDICCLPAQTFSRIKLIVVFGEPSKKKASAEENIGVVFDPPLDIKRGDVVISSHEALQPIHEFSAHIFWLTAQPLRSQQTITLRCATQEMQATIRSIQKRVDPATLEVQEENAQELQMNEVGVVRIKTEKPMVVENFDFIEDLGRFVIEDANQLNGAGIVI